MPAATTGFGTMTVLRRAMPSSAQRTQYSGYVGDPADATIEAGEKCFDLYADWISDVVIKYIG